MNASKKSGLMRRSSRSWTLSSTSGVTSRVTMQGVASAYSSRSTGLRSSATVRTALRLGPGDLVPVVHVHVVDVVLERDDGRLPGGSGGESEGRVDLRLGDASVRAVLVPQESFGQL